MTLTIPSPPIATLVVAVFVVVSGCSAVGVEPSADPSPTFIVDTGTETPADAPTPTDVATDVETETKTETDTSTDTAANSPTPTASPTPTPTPTPTAAADTPTATPEPEEYDAEAEFKANLRERGIGVEEFLVSENGGTWAMQYDSYVADAGAFDERVWSEFADEARTITHAYCDAAVVQEGEWDLGETHSENVIVYTGGHIRFEVRSHDCAHYRAWTLEHPEVDLMGFVFDSVYVNPLNEEGPSESDLE